MPATKTSRFASIDEDISSRRVNPSMCKTCDFLANPGRYQAGRADVEFITGLLLTRSASHVSRVLADGGVKISETSVKRHRFHMAP